MAGSITVEPREAFPSRKHVGILRPDFELYGCEVKPWSFGQDGQVSDRGYASTVTHAIAPLEVFGSDKTVCRSKTEAKHNAAEDVVK